MKEQINKENKVKNNSIYKIKKTNKFMKVLYTNGDQFLNKKEDLLTFPHE